MDWFCPKCGVKNKAALFTCVGCGFQRIDVQQSSQPVAYATNVVANSMTVQNTDEVTIRRIADYEQISGIIWIVLGILQVLSVVGIIAGAWNIYAGYTRIQTVPRIRARAAYIPLSVENMTPYIIIGVINLFVGGVIGVAFVALDLYIRDLILKNRYLFTV